MHRQGCAATKHLFPRVQRSPRCPLTKLWEEYSHKRILLRTEWSINDPNGNCLWDTWHCELQSPRTRLRFLAIDLGRQLVRGRDLPLQLQGRVHYRDLPAASPWHCRTQRLELAQNEAARGQGVDQGL